jgi:hypothetical protein
MSEIPRQNPLTTNIPLKKEGQECKTGSVWGWVLVGGEKVNREGKYGG